MKKILLLGGSKQQVPAIIKAKSREYHTILCDYLEDNPGRNYSDEFYCISTTDKDAILKLATEKRIDGILAYASDPAALTAAYVSKLLGLPSNSYEAVLILSRKNLFRQFLKDNCFNCPQAAWFKSIKDALEGINGFNFPLMIKPVDSSGSKGVSCVNGMDDFKFAFEKAMEKSREGIVIVEEYVSMSHECMIGGDGFIIDGKLEFAGFLNSHRNAGKYLLVPVGTSYPLFVNNEKALLARNEIQRLIDLLKIKMGAINIEVMFDNQNRPYIMEIGPRNGGNMIPELLEIVTGLDLISASLEIALGNNKINLNYKKREVYYSTYVIHSNVRGKLIDVSYSNDIQKNIIKQVMYKQQGMQIDEFDSADKAIGIAFLKFENLEELKHKMNRMPENITVNVSD